MKFNLNIPNSELINVVGPLNSNLDLIAKTLNVNIKSKGETFNITGNNAAYAKKIIQNLAKLSKDKNIELEDIDVLLKQSQYKDFKNYNELTIKTDLKYIKARSLNQQKYIKAIGKKDCVFAIGPAGTGKTYLAVSCACEALEKALITRIILVRPVVEAGEKLGFLPGDLSEKIDPYLRPIFDALHDMLGVGKVEKLIEKNIIEIAPLAFMRGRTLNDAFIILDEAQNTTIEQMKMFLTRLGYGSKMVITGDITQIDLEDSSESGLIHATKVLKNEKLISFCYFQAKDVFRHNLVEKIVQAYERFQ